MLGVIFNMCASNFFLRDGIRQFGVSDRLTVSGVPDNGDDLKVFSVENARAELPSFLANDTSPRFQTSPDAQR